MNSIVLTVGVVVIFVVSLFVFWRKLKEDFIPSQIFGIGFTLLLLTTTSFSIVGFFKLEESRWLIVVIPLLAVIVYTKRNRMRINEILNALAPGFLLANTIYYLGKIGEGLVYIIPVIFILLLLFLFSTLERNFKNFHWYTSGKVGFSALVVYTAFFLVNAIVAFVLPDMVFFTGKINALISILFGAVSLVSLKILSKNIS